MNLGSEFGKIRAELLVLLQVARPDYYVLIRWSTDLFGIFCEAVRELFRFAMTLVHWLPASPMRSDGRVII